MMVAPCFTGIGYPDFDSSNLIVKGGAVLRVEVLNIMNVCSFPTVSSYVSSMLRGVLALGTMRKRTCSSVQTIRISLPQPPELFRADRNERMFRPFKFGIPVATIRLVLEAISPPAPLP